MRSDAFSLHAPCIIELGNQPNLRPRCTDNAGPAELPFRVIVGVARVGRDVRPHAIAARLCYWSRFGLN
jgi:hypothetical protein